MTWLIKISPIMWQINQNLSTKNKLKSDSFSQIYQHAVIHQWPKPDLHGSFKTLYPDTITTSHPTPTYLDKPNLKYISSCFWLKSICHNFYIFCLFFVFLFCFVYLFVFSCCFCFVLFCFVFFFSLFSFFLSFFLSFFIFFWPFEEPLNIARGIP